MAGTPDSFCPEFSTTWVRSGQFLSLDKRPVPDEVRQAPPVPGVHQIHVDAARNLYVTEVANDRSQMFRPKANADPNKIIGPMAIVNPRPSR